MIFKNIDMDRNYKNRYLFVDDMSDENKSVPDEILESILPEKGKVIIGTIGTFNIKNFEGIAGRLKDV